MKLEATLHPAFPPDKQPPAGEGWHYVTIGDGDDPLAHACRRTGESNYSWTAIDAFDWIDDFGWDEVLIRNCMWLKAFDEVLPAWGE